MHYDKDRGDRVTDQFINELSKAELIVATIMQRVKERLFTKNGTPRKYRESLLTDIFHQVGKELGVNLIVYNVSHFFYTTWRINVSTASGKAEACN